MGSYAQEPVEPVVLEGTANVADQLGVRFDERGLVPCVVQQQGTGEVLMMAWMNAESLALTVSTGTTWFWSRSRQELWNKGATSGHVQRIVSIDADCDDDTLLVRVKQTGPACHTGSYSCFFKRIYSANIKDTVE